MEHYLIGRMLKEGLDVYIPMVDDDAIDAVVKRSDGSFGDAALIAAITHEKRDNYWFVFYSERMETMWIMSSGEFLKEATQPNKSVKNMGKRSIWLNGKNTKDQKEHPRPQFKKYIVENFDRIKNEIPI